MRKLINIFLVFILLINFFIILIPNVNAAYTATVTDSAGLYVRSGPGTNYSQIALLSLGTTVTLVNNTKVNGTGCNGWYQINYNGSTERYICSEFVSINQDDSNTSIKGDYYTSTVWGMRVSEDYAYIRSAPDMNLAKTDTIYLGTTVKVLEENGAKNNCSEGWYKVSYYNDTKSGWICKRFVDKYENITATDTTIANKLKAAGFPDSYIPFLTYLQKKYPNWVFKAIKTNKDFDDVVKKQEGKNYTQSTVSQYRLNNTLKESPNWYAASTPLVAYYLDPRNYLNEKNICVFEDLAYDKDHHISSVVKSLFGSSYLSEPEYINYFMKAAADYNVSPVHLAARVKQEGGTDKTYAAVSGTYTGTYDGKTLKNFYNYYNIGAYADSKTSSPVTRGLAAAAGYVDSYFGTPWNTREKAILYGARFIANSYINAGQNTLYFQKFNTGPNNTYASHTHQYMTNAIAPASESLSTYGSYKDMKILNTPFVFSIPVYNKMPEEFTIHPLVGNTNRDLSDIKINGNSVNGFDSDVLTYTHYIANNITSVDVSATPIVSTTTISGIGKINITGNTTKVTIVVTSQSGLSKTYILSIVKTDVDPDAEPTVAEILKKVDIKLSNQYMSGITVGTTSTTLSNSINKQAPNAKISIMDTGNKKVATLATGHKITIISGNDSKTYTIIIRGDTNGDSKVNITDLLRIQKHLLGTSKLTGNYYEACDTNYDNKVDIKDLLRIQKHILKDITLK